METRSIKNLYLPKKLAIHAKILLFSIIFTPIWGLFIHDLSLFFLIGTFSILVTDLEIMLFILIKFKKLASKHAPNFEDENSPRKITTVYTLSFFVFLLMVLIINTIVFCLFIILIHYVRGYGFPDLYAIMVHGEVIKITAIGLLFGIPIFFFSKWQEAMKREFKLKEQKLIFQNETLKNQVNPHFLFNSLNTLSALVGDQAELAERFVLKLSLIYRYILENSSKTKVPLKDEMNFVKDFFYLHEIRNEGKIHLNIDINDEDKYYILPVSLQLLLENAIKHNMATEKDPLEIFIFKENEMIVVKNKLCEMASQLDSTKVGLKNLNDRARLLTGSEIIINKTQSEFLVKIPLLK